MAYVLQDENEEEQLVGGSGPIVSSQGGEVIGDQQTTNDQVASNVQQPIELSGGGAASISGTQSTPARSTPAESPQTSTGFINIQRYIDQNRPQAAQLGERVGGLIEQEGQEAVGAIQSAQDQFIQQAESQIVQPNQEVIDQAASEEFRGFEDPTQTEQFTQAFNAPEYTGPESLVASGEPYTSALKEVGDIETMRELVQSDSGRKELLSRIQDTRRASQGVTTLDNALLGINPKSRETLQQASDAYSDLDQRLSAANLTAQQTGQNVSQQNLELQGQLRDQFLGEGGVITSLGEQIGGQQEAIAQYENQVRQINLANQPIVQANNQRTAEYNAAVQDTAAKNQLLNDLMTRYSQVFQLNDAQMAQLRSLGISNDQFFDIYRSGNWTTQFAPPPPPSLQATHQLPTNPGAVSPEDMQRLEALAELAGVSVQDMLATAGQV